MSTRSYRHLLENHPFGIMNKRREEISYEIAIRYHHSNQIRAISKRFVGVWSRIFVTKSNPLLTLFNFSNSISNLIHFLQQNSFSVLMWRRLWTNKDCGCDRLRQSSNEPAFPTLDCSCVGCSSSSSTKSGTKTLWSREQNVYTLLYKSTTLH